MVDVDTRWSQGSVGTSYMIPIVYRDVDSYSVPRLSYGVPNYLAYFFVLGCVSVLASLSYLAYQPLFGKCKPTLLPQNRALVITRACQMK